MAPIAKVRPGQSQELHSDLPSGLQDPKVPGPFSFTFPGVLSVSLTLSGAAGAQTGTPVRDTTSVSGGLTCGTTNVALLLTL